MTELQQILDISMGYLHIFVKFDSRMIYTHCHIYRLNLVIGASCNIHCVRNIFDQIKEISYFFKFSKPRQRMLINSIKEHAPDSQKKEITWFLSHSMDWKSNRIGWFWKPFCSNCIFFLKKWVWTWGAYIIKIHQQILFNFIN